MHSRTAQRHNSPAPSRSMLGRLGILRSRTLMAVSAVVILLGTTSIISSSSAMGAAFSPISKGDIVASLADGQVNQYSPSGSFVQTLISNANTPTGSAFDGAGNLYVTEFEGNDVLKVDGSTGAVFRLCDDYNPRGRYVIRFSLRASPSVPVTRGCTYRTLIGSDLMAVYTSSIRQQVKASASLSSRLAQGLRVQVNQTGWPSIIPEHCS